MLKTKWTMTKRHRQTFSVALARLIVVALKDS